MEEEARRKEPFDYRNYKKPEPKKKKKRKKPKKRNRKTEVKRVYPPFQLAYRELLRREGLTQKTLADALGISPSIVCRDLKRPNYIDPKLRYYVEMLGYRIVLSFEKVGEPQIVRHEKSEVVKQAIKNKEEKMRSKKIQLGDEKTEEEIGGIAGKYGTAVFEKGTKEEAGNETEIIAFKYKEMNLDV